MGIIIVVAIASAQREVAFDLAAVSARVIPLEHC